MKPHKAAFLVLAVAITAISTAAILVRLIPDVPPATAAFWRTALVALLLSPSLISHNKTAKPLSTRDRQLIVLAGATLAAHFLTWFASLHYTSVLRSTLLVCLTPIWTGAAETFFFKTPPSKRFWPGIAIALIGLALMSSPSELPTSRVGDLLALSGGILSAIYLLIGRAVRPRIPIGPYGAMICGVCALCLLPVILITKAPLFALSAREIGFLLALALGPQLLGHIGLNFAVRYVSAATIGALILLEPIGASILAAALFSEIPTSIELGGGLLILTGVLVANWKRRTHRRAPTRI